MCIIIIKDKNEDIPSSQILNDAWDENPHGAGIMWMRGNKVGFEKGFMDKQKMFERLEHLNFQKGDIVAYHFRWATSGEKDMKTTHPFLIGKDKKLRKNLNDMDTKKAVMMHNGIIQDLNDKKHVSDTQRFATWYMPSIPLKDVYENKVIQKLIVKFVDDSRLLILHHRLGILKLGDWTTCKGYSMSKKLQDRYHNTIGYGRSTYFDSFYKDDSESSMRDHEIDADERCESCNQHSIFNDSCYFVHTIGLRMCYECRVMEVEEDIAAYYDEDMELNSNDIYELSENYGVLYQTIENKIKEISEDTTFAKATKQKE